MGSRKVDAAGAGVRMAGFAILDDRFSPDTLQAVGAGTTDSSYNEAGPRPGQPSIADTNALLEPRVSGAQGTGIDVRVERPGMPGRDECHVSWRLASETTDQDYRGWQSANYATEWVVLEWSTTDTYDGFDVVVVPSTQTPVVVYTGSGVAVQARSFEFDNGAWSAAATVDTDTIPQLATAVVIPESERIIAWYGLQTFNAASSTDEGATWSNYSGRDVLLGDPSAAAVRVRAAYDRGDIILFYEEAGGHLTQYASSDLGATFRRVNRELDIGTSVSVAVLPGGNGIIMAYCDDSGTPTPIIRRIGSPFQSYADATEVQVSSPLLNLDELEILADYDGTLYLIGREFTGGVVTDQIWVWVSHDLGDTWTQHTQMAWQSQTNADYPVNFAYIACRGWHLLVHNWVSNVATTTNGSIGTLWFAGWSNVENGENAVFQPLEAFRESWGKTATDDATVWIPIELPSDGFGNYTVAGAGTSTLTNGYVEIITAGQARYFEADPVVSGLTEFSMELHVQVVSRLGTLALNVAGVLMRMANGVVDYEWELNLGTAGFRLEDQSGSAGDLDVTFDLTTWAVIKVSVLNRNVVDIWYRRPWETKWTYAGARTMGDTGNANADNRLRWGNPAVGTATTRWRLVPYAPLSRGDWHENDATDDTRRISGRALNVHPYPVPEIGDSTREAYLHLRAGPGVMDEVYEIQPVFDYEVERALLLVSSNVEVKWRSDDLTEQYLTFELDPNVDARIGDNWSLVLGIFESNIRSAFLEYLDGASVWQTALTYDGTQGHATLGYQRLGNLVRGNATPAASRHIGRNEFARGYVDFGSGVVRKIASNKGGGWSLGATTSHAEFRLEDMDDTEPVGGGALRITLVAPNGVAVGYAATGNRSEHWRIRIPVQDVAESFYFAGGIFVGAFNPVGHLHDRGLVHRIAPNAERNVDDVGVVRRVSTGPVRHGLTGAYNRVDMLQIRAGTDNDYIGPDIGEPLVVVDDVFPELWGVVQDTESGRLPVIWLLDVDPSADETITDRTRWAMGLFESAVEATVVLGKDGQGEHVNVARINLTGLV